MAPALDVEERRRLNAKLPHCFGVVSVLLGCSSVSARKPIEPDKGGLDLLSIRINLDRTFGEVGSSSKMPRVEISPDRVLHYPQIASVKGVPVRR